MDEMVKQAIFGLPSKNMRRALGYSEHHPLEALSYGILTASELGHMSKSQHPAITKLLPLLSAGVLARWGLGHALKVPQVRKSLKTLKNTLGR